MKMRIPGDISLYNPATSPYLSLRQSEMGTSPVYQTFLGMKSELPKIGNVGGPGGNPNGFLFFFLAQQRNRHKMKKPKIREAPIADIPIKLANLPAVQIVNTLHCNVSCYKSTLCLTFIFCNFIAIAYILWYKQFSLIRLSM